MGSRPSRYRASPSLSGWKRSKIRWSTASKKGHPDVDRLLVLARRHTQHHAEYARLWQEQTWLRELDRLLTPDPDQAYGEEAAWEAHWSVWGLVTTLTRTASAEHHDLVHPLPTWLRNIGHPPHP